MFDYMYVCIIQVLYIGEFILRYKGYIDREPYVPKWKLCSYTLGPFGVPIGGDTLDVMTALLEDFKLFVLNCELYLL